MTTPRARGASRPWIVHVHNHQQAVAVHELIRRRLVHRAVGKVLEQHVGRARRPVEVSVALVDDETIQELNGRFRAIPKPTDVLSFRLEEEPDRVAGPPGEPVLLGEIVISAPRAEQQAREYGHSLEREMAYLAVHGCLHLLGYDHEDEASRKVMRAQEEAALEACGLGR
ncbi:rRNA maturation RNase YbeY [Carboxydochorda subterranea]|uniref:Endoribonuclease YbeY n=1 Tax=Carboxydichorda subterranea TaxID=3109565 RepID=A0ABZ1BZZ2_9FIRM|nr:rRNA maturation RNase YbeY [Limnochorda sp. L945t]WRP18284.1 rRNA maturation RNase YbeY [Limnochorda sp. L945t]